MSCKPFFSLRNVFLTLSLLISASPLFAQYGAAIEGTVSDQTGAVVAGATVTAKNEANGVSRNTTTGDSGFYRIVGLTPGSYTVTVEAQSFPSKDIAKVVIGAEAVSGLDVTLQSGSAKESVTVSAEPGGLESENANVSNTVTSREIVNLPSFGRDPYELLRLTPGIFADSARQSNGNSVTLPQQVGPGGSNAQIFQTENQVQAVANGQRITANNFTLDGVSVNSLDWGGSAVVTPNEESVQEIVVTSNSYSAQEGRNSGAQVKAVSKYGTNDFHGSAFFKINDKGLNAFNKYYGSSVGPLPTITCEGFTPSQFMITANHCPTRVDQKYRDFAGSVGGPIFKNRLFFFRLI